MHLCLRDLPEEEQHSLREGLEVVVPVDFCGIIQGNFAKHLSGRTNRKLVTHGQRVLLFDHCSMVSAGDWSGRGADGSVQVKSKGNSPTEQPGRHLPPNWPLTPAPHPDEGQGKGVLSP